MSNDILTIALCSPEWEPLQRAMNGGTADATYIIQKDIAERLRDRAHDLTFIAPDGLGDVVCTKDPAAPAIAPRTWSASSLFDGASKAAWRVQDGLGVPYLNIFSNYRRYDACLQCLPGHDVVYERNGLYNSGVARACKKLDMPYVLFVEADEILEHDYMGKPITGLLRRRAKRIFHQNLYAADAIICVSDQLRNHLVSNWDVPVDRTVVFPNAVDTERFRPYPETSAEIRKSLDVGDGPLIIFVGSFYEWHDVAALLDSFAEVLRSYPEARLVLVGDGEQRQKMEQRSEDLEMQHAVQFTGFIAREKIPYLMSTADIAVAPYPELDHELWLSPLKLYEYMASGTAVVATEGGQIKEAIEDGRNGLLVPPGDIAALSNALCRLIANPELRMQLAGQARADVEQNNSWDHYILNLERLFEEVIASRSTA